jgi:hypothetical protein
MSKKMKNEFKRDPIALKRKAVLYWPTELAKKEQTTSIIPRLISTQDKFISILHVSDNGPESWKTVLLETKGLPGNVFLKHLMVLADVGGEPLQRIKAGFRDIFPNNKMAYIWKGKKHEYHFKEIKKASRVTNTALYVDGKRFSSDQQLLPLMEDVAMLLLHGSTVQTESIPEIVRDRCIIGSLIGDKQEIEKFVKQRYIWVSRITGGATSNTMGQIAQDYVRDILSENLPDWKIKRNGTIPGISHNAGDTDISFDIVAMSPKKKWYAIEVSFQFTTNSVIERKAGQAEARAKLLHEAGHKIIYVIDGAGNFARVSALTTICKYSDCTVAFAPREIDVLLTFLKKR